MYAYRIEGAADLLTIMRQRREEIGETHLGMDERVGLASGHYGKIEKAGTAWGKRAFYMSKSMTWILEALGLELVLVPKGTIAALDVERDVRVIPYDEFEEHRRKRRKVPKSKSMVANWRKRKAETKKPATA